MANLTRNMHYDFKMKLNKVDSQKYNNLRVPQIDWKLNEAQEMMIKMIAFPRMFQGTSFEFNQRSIDDLRTIVVERASLPLASINTERSFAVLPNDYLHHISSYARCVSGNCEKLIRTTIVQHDDQFETNPFAKSSFEWEQVNVNFSSDGIMLYKDDFTIMNFYLTYLRKPKFIHSAQDSVGETYTLPDGTVLTGYQNCELPEVLHKEIVDLAVLITTGDLLADYTVKQMKTRMTN